MKEMEMFHQAVLKILDSISKETEAIDKAAHVLAEQVGKDRLIYVLGSGGHSFMGAEEMFYRAGGLIPIQPMLDPGLSLANGARRTTLVERTVGYAKVILETYGVERGSALIIVNVNGINSVTIDTALECRKRGITTIALTSREFSNNVPPNTPSRHPSNKNLADIADITIDLHVPVGDAVGELEGLDIKVGSTSTIAVAFAANALVIRTVAILIEQGIKPPVWLSANIPGGDEYMKPFLEKYGNRIRHL